MRHCAYKFIFQLFQDFNLTNIFTITGKIRESLNFKKGLAPAGPKIKMKTEQQESVVNESHALFHGISWNVYFNVSIRIKIILKINKLLVHVMKYMLFFIRKLVMLIVLDFLKNFSKFQYQNFLKTFLNLRAVFCCFDCEEGNNILYLY